MIGWCYKLCDKLRTRAHQSLIKPHESVWYLHARSVYRIFKLSSESGWLLEQLPFYIIFELTNELLGGILASPQTSSNPLYR